MQPGGHRFDPGQLHQNSRLDMRRNDMPRWHGLRLSKAPVSVVGAFLFAAGILVLISLDLSAARLALSAALLGAGAFGLVKVVRKVKS